VERHRRREARLIRYTWANRFMAIRLSPGGAKRQGRYWPFPFHKKKDAGLIE
jgi:hypothetical protein